ncbi:MAG: SGNH/GDSL hydrolase family protein, partial [Sulfurimonas sp.]|uniref:hypothetical protein n=1 Tax=Sulfurimonas sp. TaxID=2022749 RepID=UPI003566D5BB
MTSTYIDLFKSYHWNELYESVKLTQYDSAIPIQSQQPLALKAMLLVSWWQDSVTSKEIFKHFPPLLTDPLTHFCVAYGYMCLGDVPKLKHYLKNTPKAQPKWMKIYLDLEYQGRSLKFHEQIKTLKKITSTNNFPDYAIVALLQSLEHEKADITLLKEYLSSLSLSPNSPSPLMILLYNRAGLIHIDDVDVSTSPLLLLRKSRHLFRSLELIDTLKSYDLLVQTKMLDINCINEWLMTSVSIPQGRDYLLKRVEFALSLAPNSLFIQGTLASYALIHSYRSGEYKTAYAIVLKYHEYTKLAKSYFIKNAQVFFNYTLSLCATWQHNTHLYANDSQNLKPIEVYGESHSLSLSNIRLDSLYNNECFGRINFVMGAKMHHLKKDNDTFYSKALQLYFQTIQNSANLIFTIGEIDTRPDEGIWQVHLKKEKNLEEIIDNTVGGYIGFLYENLKEKQLNSITIQGIPVPNYALEGDKDPKDKEGFLNMIKQVNEKLKNLTLEKGWNFLDVYSATLGEDGKSNKKWHIDGYHLQPIFYTEA